MSELILYLTARDADQFRKWVNAESSIAWIVKESQAGLDYVWRAVHEIPSIAPQEYCLWQVRSDPLSIPSGSPRVPDTPIADPFSGWQQRLSNANATAPWFGGNLPGPYFFQFREVGRSDPDSIGRSGLFWHGDHFRPIGKPASEEAKAGWRSIQQFVKRCAISIPWPHHRPHKTRRAYAFEDAYLKIQSGAVPDPNP